jgi:hypothetical protein
MRIFLENGLVLHEKRDLLPNLLIGVEESVEGLGPITRNLEMK